MVTPLFFDVPGGASLAGQSVAVIGYGSQGRAHALNLRDSGVDVAVGLRPGSPSAERAAAAGLEVLPVDEAARRADLVSLLVPDEVQGDVYRESIAPVLAPGNVLCFAHGFAVHFGLVAPPPHVDVILAAPKGPGPLVRSEYRRGGGLLTLVGVHQDHTGAALARACAYAAAIGASRGGMLETTFGEECETDLFGEQAVLCGGLPELVTAGFETLVEAGYSPEMAYLECLHEVLFVADLMHRRGIAGMRRAISRTAAYGGITRGRRLVTEAVREEMRRILAEIREGGFAREWRAAAARGGAAALVAAEAAHPIEAAGANLRRAMGDAPDGEGDDDGA